MKSYQFNISGITCGACIKLITGRIRRISGVSEVSVGESGSATVQSDRDIAIEELKRVLEGTQYEVISNQL